MNYDIIATLGPSSAAENVWQAMLAAGVDAFRLNTSHLSLEQLRSWLGRLSAFFETSHAVAPVYLDLQGSKWRLGDFSPLTLMPGQEVELSFSKTAGRAGVLPVPHRDFFTAIAERGGRVALNDAKILLDLVGGQGTSWIARVAQGGEIRPNKGITLPGTEVRIESLSEKDQAIFEIARTYSFTRLAVSYVKDAVEMQRYRSLFGAGVYLAAKLERPQAVDEARQIAEIADEAWLCRGDLGAELGPAAMARAVHAFSGQAGLLPIPTYLAGQVLEHLAQNPAPTRSEVCYLYDSLKRGYHGVVLSDETAIGHFVLEACRAAALFKMEPGNDGTEKSGSL